jgi:predicted nucleotidyltransferase
MRTGEMADIDDSLPLEELRAILREHPVRLAVLFGSHATGEAHPTSDVDIAVDFEAIARDDPAYNDTLFGLSADLSAALDTDDVDLVDVRTLSPAVAEAVFDHGVVLVGDRSTVAEVRQRLTAPPEAEERSPRERFDSALARIDEHLRAAAGPASEGDQRER